MPKLLPTPAQLQRAKRDGWENWIVTKQDEIAVAQGCYFDIGAALGTRALFEGVLTHGKAPFAGMPFILEPWQWHQIIGPLYGWRMPDGTRRYMSAFIFMPKKNGKTQIFAGIGIRELYEQIGARVFMAAVSREQLTIDGCFDEAAGMVERSPQLQQSLDVRRGTNRILFPARSAFLTAISASAGSSEGKNASALLLDELHAWKNRELFNSLLYADTARVNSFVGMITTAGDEMTSLCYEEYERAVRIRDGKDLTIDHLCVLYEADKDARYDDIEQWQKANPNFGVTLPLRKIERAIAQAKGSPQRIQALKRYRLNIWTQSADSWLDVDAWDKLPSIDVSELLPDGDGNRPLVYGGLDLARVRDFAAFAWAWKNAKTGAVSFRVRIWIPRERIAEKEKSDKIPLSDWVERGFVIATDGDEIDYSEIRREILKIHNENQLAELGYDPYNAAHLCNQQLGAEDGLEVVEVPQTMPHMCGPSAEFERLLNAGNIRHEHNPALAWMIGNAVTVTDNNENFRPIKKKSRGRIDGLVAMLITLSRVQAGNNPNRKGFYDDHEAELV